MGAKGAQVSSLFTFFGTKFTNSFLHFKKMFENIITGIHFNNKKDKQKLKHGSK